MGEQLSEPQDGKLALEMFRMLKAEQRLAAGEVDHVCRRIAFHLKEPRGLNPRFVREAIGVLCEVATMPDERLRTEGQRAIFESIVERLSDSFQPEHVPIYNRMFAQIIDYCRRVSGGEELDRELLRFKIYAETDLLSRKDRIDSAKSPAGPWRNAVKRAFVVSRITLGADVAVTSVIVQSLTLAFPNAEITLIGPKGLQDLYRNTDRFRTLQVTYDRHGSLLDRLGNWVDLVHTIDAERRGLQPGEYIIVDPDSRLTQLGLLPLTEQEDRYFFFESRSYRKAGRQRLGELAAEWCRDVFEQQAELLPFVRLSQKDLDCGSYYCELLRKGRTGKVVAFNFGVGGNASKQLSLDFEIQLLLQTLDRGHSVILDKGIGKECDRADQVAGQLKAAGKKICERNAHTASTLDDSPADTEAVVWEGAAGTFAGLIASADLYCGYDSAFQHIAAALAVPVIDIFARPEDERFIERWTPYSRAPVAVVKVAPSEVDAAGRILALFPRLIRP